MNANANASATARALFFDGPRRVAIRDVPLAARKNGEIHVRGMASAISQGTELLLYRGEGPTPFDPSLSSATSNTTTTTYPCRYGYAWVGAKEDGSRIFALLPHGDAHVIPESSVRSIRDDIPASRATLAANLETAITCTWDAAPSLGDRALVLGGGVVGILTAWLLQRSGCAVTLIDPRAVRRACARELVGTLDVAACAPCDASVDVVIEATGDPYALDAAVASSAHSARIIVASFYGKRRAPVDLGDAFHRRRLSIIASQVSSIPALMTRRWDFDRRFALVQDLLGEPKLDALIAPSIPFDHAPETYAKLDSNADDTLPCHVFAYDG